jgi:hypothetical protein
MHAGELSCGRTAHRFFLEAANPYHAAIAFERCLSGESRLTLIRR